MKKLSPIEYSAEDNLETGIQFTRLLLATLNAFNDGDFTARLPSDLTGLNGKVADALNQVIARTERFGDGLTRLGAEVGKKGKINARLPLGDSVGGWAKRIDTLNSLVNDMSQPTLEMGRVIGAVAKGDLTQSVPLEVGGRPLQGEYLRTAKSWWNSWPGSRWK